MPTVNSVSLPGERSGVGPRVGHWRRSSLHEIAAFVELHKIAGVEVPVNRFQSLWRTKSMVWLILQSRNWADAEDEIHGEDKNQHTWVAEN